jgi:hypothetical protein
MLVHLRRSGARWAALVGPALALVLAATSAHGAGAGVGTATDEQKAEAGKSYQRGADAFAAGELEKALEEFQRSLDVVSSPNSRLMLARTLAKLGRNAEAYAQLEQTVADAEAAAQIDKKYASTVDAARGELADLKPLVGLVTVRVSESTSDDSLSVGGREIEPANWERPVAVAPGKVRVVLRTANGETVREVDVAAGASAAVEIAPPPPKAKPVTEPPPVVEVSTESSSTRTLGFVAGGIGLAGIASFAVFGGLNNSKFRKLEDECINSRCSSELQSEKDQGKTYQTIANVSLAVGLVGIATGTVLLLMSGGDGDPEQEARAERRRIRSTAPRVGIGLGYVDVSGSF